MGAAIEQSCGGTTATSDKLTGNFGSALEDTSIGDYRLIALFAEKTLKAIFGVLQHYPHKSGHPLPRGIRSWIGPHLTRAVNCGEELLNCESREINYQLTLCEFNQVTRNSRSSRLTVEELATDCIDVRDLNKAGGAQRRLGYHSDWDPVARYPDNEGGAIPRSD